MHHETLIPQSVVPVLEDVIVGVIFPDSESNPENAHVLEDYPVIEVIIVPGI